MRLRQVRDQVRGVLDPARQPHEIGRHGRVGVLHRLVRHRLRHLDQRLHAAERLGQREDLQRGGDPRRVGVAEADHAGEARPADVAHAAAPRAATRDHRARVLACAPPSAGAACASRGARGSSRRARARRRPSSARTSRLVARARRARPPRRRPCRSARRGTSSSSARRRRRRAPAGAGRSAWRTCCRPPRTRRPCARRSPRRRPPSATGWSASRPRSASSRAAPRRATASRSDWSTIVYSRPQRESTLSTSRYVPP